MTIRMYLYAALALAVGAWAVTFHQRALDDRESAVRAEIDRERLVATVAAQAEHIEQDRAIAAQAVLDLKTITETLTASTARVNAAANTYRSHADANPLPAGCRWDAERVRAIDAARTAGPGTP